MIINKLETKGIANRVKLNQSFVEKLPTKNKQYFVCDTETIGLRIVINITGVKTFYLQRYNKKTKYSARYKIGNYPECSVHMARAISQKVKAMSVQGQDPSFTLKESEAAKTCGDVMREFLDKRYNIHSKTKKKSTIYSVRASLEAWFFGNSNDPEINKIWKQHKEVKY